MSTTLGQQPFGSIVRDSGIEYIAIQRGNLDSRYSGFEGGTVCLINQSWGGNTSFAPWDTNGQSQGYTQSNALSVISNFSNHMSAAIRGRLMNVTIPGGVWSGQNVFLLSSEEIGNVSGGTAFSWFAGVDGNTIQSRRIMPGTNSHWWTRTGTGNAPFTMAIGVGLDGAIISNGLVTQARHLRLAVVLPDSLFIDSNGNLSTTPPAPPISPPTIPPSITIPATVIGGQNFTVSWGASTDPQWQAITYTLERSLNSGAWTQAASTVGTSSTQNVAAGTNAVQFRVRANNTSGLSSGWRDSVTRTVTTSNPPIISGTNSDLGLKDSAFTQDYTVTAGTTGDTLTVTERLNNVQIRQYTAVSGEQQNLNIDAERFISAPNGSNTLTVTASNQHGQTATRTWTFSRDETKINLALETPLEASDMPARILIGVERQIQTGGIFQVLVCNSGHDAMPTWEDCTNAVLANMMYHFQNATKTADEWGINIRVLIDRNNAVGEFWMSSIGGNFDGGVGTMSTQFFISVAEMKGVGS